MYGQEEVVANPGSLTMRNMRLRGLVKWAYDVAEHQIAGPEWIGRPGWRGNDLARFEVAAKASGDATVAEMRKMLQGLLAERFQLSLHRENKQATVFVVTAVKGAAPLKAGDPNGAGKCEGRGPALVCENTPIAEILDMLSTPLGAPVVDETGLGARYNFTINAPDVQPGEDLTGPIMRSVQAALGVKFEKGARQIDMLVIDGVEKAPTAN